MRKATKILLLISEIICFVGIAVLIIMGIVNIANGCNPEAYLKSLVDGGMTGITIETVKNVYCPVAITTGVILLIAGVFCIPAGIVTTMARHKFVKGTTKKEMKTTSIVMIVLGALSCELPIVPAIFMLAMNKDQFADEKTTKKSK